MGKKFITPTGEEYEYHTDNYHGKYLSLILGREYEEKEYENLYSTDYYKYIKACEDKLVKKKITLLINGKGLGEATDICLVLEDKNWKEYETVKSYDGSCIQNTEYKMKIEIVLVSESYSRRFFFDYDGKGKYKMNFADIIESLDDLYEKLKDNYGEYGGRLSDGEYEFEFYDETGEHVFIPVTRTDFKDMLVSARVVEYEETICGL